jgi:hypothetical protein
VYRELWWRVDGKLNFVRLLFRFRNVTRILAKIFAPNLLKYVKFGRDLGITAPVNGVCRC